MNEIKVDFFNINTGETIYVNRPAQIKAAIESSDLGINRQSDRGWRIGKEWKAKLRQARGNRELMNNLAVKYNGEVTEAQLLVAVFARESRLARQSDFGYEEGKFEQQYMEDIKPAKPQPEVETADPAPGQGETFTPAPKATKPKSSK